MTIIEFYSKMGGDYEDMLRRLMNDNLMNRFLLKFLDDPTFNLLSAAIAENDGPSAFRGAHTLKGVAMNLGLEVLGNSASKLTELLRENVISTEAVLAFEQLKEDYRYTMACIEELKNS